MGGQPEPTPGFQTDALPARAAESLLETRVRLVGARFEPGWVFFHREVPGRGRRRPWPAALFAARVTDEAWEPADVAALLHLPRARIGPGRDLEVRFESIGRSQNTRTRMLAPLPATAGALWIVSEEVGGVTEGRARAFMARREHDGLLTRHPSPWGPDDEILTRLWKHVTGVDMPAGAYALVTVPGVQSHRVRIWAPVTDTRDALWVALQNDRPPAGSLVGVYRRFRAAAEFGEVMANPRTRRAEGVLLVDPGVAYGVDSVHVDPIALVIIGAAGLALSRPRREPTGVPAPIAVESGRAGRPRSTPRTR